MLKLDREIYVDEDGFSYGPFISEIVDHPAVASVSFNRRTPSAMSDPRVVVEIDVDASVVEDLATFAALWGYSTWHQFLADEAESITQV
jgi:hypothetical protein